MRTRIVEFDVPEGLRIGQHLIGFFQWYQAEFRGDPFYATDERLDERHDEYLRWLAGQ